MRPRNFSDNTIHRIARANVLCLQVARELSGGAAQLHFRPLDHAGNIRWREVIDGQKTLRLLARDVERHRFFSHSLIDARCSSICS